MTQKLLNEEQMGYSSTGSVERRAGPLDLPKAGRTNSAPQLDEFNDDGFAQHGSLQSVATPQRYHYQKVNLNQENMSLDGYNNYDLNDTMSSLNPPDEEVTPKFRPPPLVRTYSPWTPRGAVMFAQDKIKPGSMKGSIFNMIIATVGGGMLSLPYGVREFGLIPGFIILCLSGWLSYYTNDFLLIASEEWDKTPASYKRDDETGARKKCKPTHLTLSQACSDKWGKQLSNFTQGMLLVQMFGGVISYNVAFGGLLDLVWTVILPDKDQPVSNVYPWIVILMTWVIIYPLSLLRSMSALRFTSLLGFACSTYLSLVLFGEYFALCKHEKTCFWMSDFHLSSKDLFNFSTFGTFLEKLLIAYPYFAFSFTNQQYSLPIYVELTKRNRPHMQKVVSYSHRIIFFQYTLSTFFSFLSFLSGTCGNILLNDFHERADVVIAAIAISVSMTLTQPITAYAWRTNFSEIFYGVKQLDKKKHVIVTTGFLFAAMVVSLLVTDIATVFGILGATTYPTIGFILPGVYVWFICPKGRFDKIKKFAIFQAICVALLSIASLCFQIYQMFGHFKNSGDCHNVQTIKTPSLF